MKRYRIDHNGQSIDYEVTHRPAVTRRIHLELAEDGCLQVVAPRRMSQRAIRKMLQHRAAYVARFLLRARARQDELPDLRYTDGEAHLFMGRHYPLEVDEQPGRRTSTAWSDGRIRLTLPRADSGKIRSQLEKWYRRQSGQHFEHRLLTYSQAAAWTAGEAPPMRLRRMKRTWGSCSSAGVITLNPHLVKAPPECIDYVIAHEICHLREHNHGKAFYALQEQLYPGWREAKAHLAEKGHIYLQT